MSELRMTRRISIEDATFEEARAIEQALCDKEFYALAITVGILKPFTNHDQELILNFVAGILQGT